MGRGGHGSSYLFAYLAGLVVYIRLSGSSLLNCSKISTSINRHRTNSTRYLQHDSTQSNSAQTTPNSNTNIYPSHNSTSIWTQPLRTTAPPPTPADLYVNPLYSSPQYLSTPSTRTATNDQSSSPAKGSARSPQ